jgi:hypothetical protein
VRSLSFVTSVGQDTVCQLDAVSPPAGTTALPSRPYWQDLIDAEHNTTYNGSGVWVAVLDSGFYPNWRDYFVESDVLTQYARTFIAAGGNQNANQWDVGSDPHGMATAATITGYKLVDDTNQGGWGVGYATGKPGTYWVPGVAPGAKVIPVKVCEPIGCFGSAINAGVDYVTNLKKANPSRPIVINESLGGSGLDPTEKAAIDAATKAGVVMVASAGNEAPPGWASPAPTSRSSRRGRAAGWTSGIPTPTRPGGCRMCRRPAWTRSMWPGFSSRQLPGQYLDVVSTGRYLLLPYPCAQLYKDGQVISSTNVRTCGSKRHPTTPMRPRSSTCSSAGPASPLQPSPGSPR